jgi:hypothetical protein
MVRRVHFIPLFLSIFLLGLIDGFSQQIRQYDSTYVPAPDLIGNARFEYYEDKDGRKIKHGDFTFIREERSKETQNAALYTSWKGQYNENRKVGEWTYESRNHLVSINNISDVALDYSIYTIDEYLEINYRDGFPEGEILLESTLYADKQPEKRLKYFQTEVKDGRMHGEFEYFLADETEDILSVYGRLENGLMVGEWGFNYHQEDKRETRQYEKGVLLSITKSNGEGPRTIEFPLSEGLQAALANKETDVELAGKPLSLHFSDGYPRTSSYITEQQKGEDAIMSILEEIFRYDQDIDLSRQLPLGTNRGFYPLSSDERKILPEWTKIEAKFRTNLQDLNNLRIESLNLAQDEETKIILGWIAEQEEIKEYIRPWNNILGKEQVEYYNRDGLLKDYAWNFLSRDTIVAEGESHIFDYEPREKPENFLLYIVENFRDRNKVGDSLIEKLTAKVETLETTKEVSGLNENIARQKKEMDSIYAFPSNYSILDYLLRKTRRDFGENIYRQELDRFVEEDNLEEKISIGQDLVVNLEIMKEIHAAAINIATRREKIDELYTEYTFDPFTFSDQVPVRKKKRLYNFVNEGVIEKILVRAGDKTSEPTEVLKELQLVQQMQERLVFLEDKNTRRLERRLLRSDSLTESVELLNSL